MNIDRFKVWSSSYHLHVRERFPVLSLMELGEKSSGFFPGLKWRICWEIWSITLYRSEGKKSEEIASTHNCGRFINNETQGSKANGKKYRNETSKAKTNEDILAKLWIKFILSIHWCARRNQLRNLYSRIESQTSTNTSWDR